MRGEGCILAEENILTGYVSDAKFSEGNTLLVRRACPTLPDRSAGSLWK
jgi:hypothetical protein